MITYSLDTVDQLLALRHTSRALYRKTSSRWAAVNDMLTFNNQAKHMLINRQLSDWVVAHPDNQARFKEALYETKTHAQLLRYCACKISPRLFDVERLPGIDANTIHISNPEQ